jgi:Na+/H+ antiporter NhaD/arsenite permease-like protein
MAATLASNFVLVGSVGQPDRRPIARVNGIVIGFWEYFKVGAPLTVC